MYRIYPILYNYYEYSEPEYITGPSGVIPIAVLKEESMVDRLLSCI